MDISSLGTLKTPLAILLVFSGAFDEEEEEEEEEDDDEDDDDEDDDDEDDDDDDDKEDEADFFDGILPFSKPFLLLVTPSHGSVNVKRMCKWSKN